MIWRETLPVVRDVWLAGTGAGTYQKAMMVYQQSERTVYFNQPHNHYLQVAAEGGLLLAGAVSLALAAFARIAVSASSGTSPESSGSESAPRAGSAPWRCKACGKPASSCQPTSRSQRCWPPSWSTSADGGPVQSRVFGVSCCLMLRLGFDVDGVLADFRSAFGETARRHLGFFDERTAFSGRDVERVWAIIGQTSNWWMQLKAYEPAEIARLYAMARASRWEVFFLTKRPASAGDSVQFRRNGGSSSTASICRQ